MIDIFDIIANQKNVRIHIKGEVSEKGLLYDTEYINELINLLTEHSKSVEFKQFNVEEKNDAEQITMNRFGIYGGFQIYKTISFDIDAYITNELNKKIDNHLQDFIDYFTVGAIVYPNTVVGYDNLSFDFHEEYLSTWTNYDIDGDVLAAEFIPTDMSNMFRNVSIDLSRLD